MTTGQCLCGDVKYAIEGKISSIWLCHCSKCRRGTGSAFHASAICGADKFAWLAGEDGIREFESTPTYVTRFCGRCGQAAERLSGEFAMQCPACGHRNYPRISPCITL